MIQGVVTAEREAIVRIAIRDANGQDHECETVVDTGYTGWLTLPPNIITALNLSWREWGAAILADGSQILFNVYDATIIWDGQPLTTPIDEADSDPLIGMRLMQGYRILIEDVDGGLVEIERI